MDDRLPPASADRAKRAKRERHDSTTEHLAKTRRRELANDGEAGTPACSILMDLPDEILFHICRSCWGACVRVRGLNKLLRRRAEPLLHEMNRLRWSKYHYHYVPPHLRSPDEPHSHQFVRYQDVGFTLHGHNNNVWCAGSVLPTVGRTAWSVFVAQSSSNVGMMYLGICDEANTCAWSLLPRQGHLRRWTRTAITGVQHLDGTPPKPVGYPNGHLNHILVTRSGERYDLYGRVKGSIIDVIYDADAGSLSFRIDGGEELPAVSGFPRGASMRPWARVVDPYDVIKVTPSFV